MSDDLGARVLAAATTLIREGGLDALSMREVARRAGVSHQAPYHHFGDREGILAALVEEGFTTLADAVEGAAGAKEGAENLAAAGVAYVRFALTHPAHFRVMFRPDLVPLDRWPAARAQASRAHTALANAVVACEEAGLVRPGEHDDVVVGAWALVHGLAVLLLDGPLAAPPPAGPVDEHADSPTAASPPTAHADALAARVAPLLARLLSERAGAGRDGLTAGRRARGRLLFSRRRAP